MCGIVGYTGSEQASPLLLGGLARLEYRGYDSAGVALLVDGELNIIRRKGKVAELRAAVEKDKDGKAATCGIGHTRWATHGVPSEANAHPHNSCDGSVAVVHNGIIENHAHLRKRLEAAGHVFTSQTDTEVIAHLVEHFYNNAMPEPILDLDGEEEVGGGEAQGDPLVEAVRATVAHLSGSFALAVVHKEHPGVIVVTRNDSPIVLGSCEHGALVASDTPAIIEHTRDITYIDDRDLAVLHPNGHIDYYDPAGTAYVPAVYHVNWTLQDAERGGYRNFMLKEIHEQPRVIRDTIAGRFDAAASKLVFEEIAITAAELADIDHIHIVACGTSYHAGLIGKDLIEMWARIPVEVEVASEFRYRNPIITPNTLIIAISQSGETADTLEAVRLARTAGARVIAITNCEGSRITQEAQVTLLIKANIEIAVAATKSFLAQVALLTLLALYFAQQRGLVTPGFVAGLYGEMQQLPAQIEQILEDEHADKIERVSAEAATAHTALFIGRGVGATTCYEGALKLKEISYVHAEAFSAGEIKHGPIALIDPAGLDDPAKQTPIIAVVTQSATYEKTLSNIEEVQARGAKVIAIATEGDERIAELTPHVIYIPPVTEALSPITASVPLQLFAVHIAEARGCDVDQPRNLAKSVTVE
jgi:glucosamine--fructose-6-phosphate aminotransferase (isomerizing)